MTTKYRAVNEKGDMLAHLHGWTVDYMWAAGEPARLFDTAHEARHAVYLRDREFKGSIPYRIEEVEVPDQPVPRDFPPPPTFTECSQAPRPPRVLIRNGLVCKLSNPLEFWPDMDGWYELRKVVPIANAGP